MCYYLVIQFKCFTSFSKIHLKPQKNSRRTSELEKTLSCRTVDFCTFNGSTLHFPPACIYAKLGYIKHIVAFSAYSICILQCCASAKTSHNSKSCPLANFTEKKKCLPSIFLCEVLVEVM